MPAGRFPGPPRNGADGMWRSQPPSVPVIYHVDTPRRAKPSLFRIVQPGRIPTCRPTRVDHSRFLRDRGTRSCSPGFTTTSQPCAGLPTTINLETAKFSPVLSGAACFSSVDTFHHRVTRILLQPGASHPAARRQSEWPAFASPDSPDAFPRRIMALRFPRLPGAVRMPLNPAHLPILMANPGRKAHLDGLVRVQVDPPYQNALQCRPGQRFSPTAVYAEVASSGFSN